MQAERRCENGFAYAEFIFGFLMFYCINFDIILYRYKSVRITRTELLICFILNRFKILKNKLEVLYEVSAGCS